MDVVRPAPGVGGLWREGGKGFVPAGGNVPVEGDFAGVYGRAADREVAPSRALRVCLERGSGRVLAVEGGYIRGKVS